MKILTEKEEDELKDLPCSYQLINYVKKPTSTTTKLRVVTNSSIRRLGGSLNSNLIMGPNILNQVANIIFKFSCHAFCLLTDLSKAYRSIHTSKETNNLRRFFWTDNNGQMKEYMMKRLTYGDKPATFYLQTCLNKISEDTTISPEKKTLSAITIMWMTEQLQNQQKKRLK